MSVDGKEKGRRKEFVRVMMSGRNACRLGGLRVA
jgi:hypothetical protein